MPKQTEAGFRDQPDVQKIQREAVRTKAEQYIQGFIDAAYKREDFDHTQFIGYVKSVKYTRSGDMEMVVTVPFEFKHLALALVDTTGIPLSWDVQTWQPFLDDTETS